MAINTRFKASVCDVPITNRYFPLKEAVARYIPDLRGVMVTTMVCGCSFFGRGELLLILKLPVEIVAYAGLLVLARAADVMMLNRLRVNRLRDKADIRGM